jgi:hypothetical protein
MRVSRWWARKLAMESSSPAVFFTATWARFVATACLLIGGVMVLCMIRYPEVCGLKGN